MPRALCAALVVGFVLLGAIVIADEAPSAEVTVPAITPAASVETAGVTPNTTCGDKIIAADAEVQTESLEANKSEAMSSELGPTGVSCDSCIFQSCEYVNQWCGGSGPPFCGSCKICPGTGQFYCHPRQ